MSQLGSVFVLVAAMLLCLSVCGQIAAQPRSDIRLRVPGQPLELRAPGKAGLPAGSEAVLLELPAAALAHKAQIPLVLFAESASTPARWEEPVEFVADVFTTEGDAQFVTNLPEVEAPAADVKSKRLIIWQAQVRLETDSFAAEHDCVVVLSMNGANRVLSFEERVGESKAQRKLLLGLVPGHFDTEHQPLVLVHDQAPEQYGVGETTSEQKRAYALIDLTFSSSKEDAPSRLLVAGHSSDLVSLERAVLASFWPLKKKESSTNTEAEIDIQIEGQTSAFLDFYRPNFMTDRQWTLVPQLWKSAVVKSGLIFGVKNQKAEADEEEDDEEEEAPIRFDPETDASEISLKDLENLLSSPDFLGVQSLEACSGPDYCLGQTEIARQQIIAPIDLTVGTDQTWTLRWPTTTNREDIKHTILALAKRWRNPEFRYTLRPSITKNIKNQVAVIQSFLDLFNTFVFLSQTPPQLPSNKQVHALLDQLAHGFLAMESKIGHVRIGPFRNQFISLSQIDGGLEISLLGGTSIIELIVGEGLRWSPALRTHMDDSGLGFDLQALHSHSANAPASDSYLSKFHSNNRIRAELQVAVKSQLLIFQNLHRILGSVETQAGMLAGPSSALSQSEARKNWLQARNVHDCRNSSKCDLSDRVVRYWNWKFGEKAIKKFCPDLQQNLEDRLNTCVSQLVSSPRVDLKPSQLMKFVSMFCSSTIFQQDLSSVPPADKEGWSNLCEDLSLSFHVYPNWRNPDFQARQACNTVQSECLPLAWTNVKQAFQKLLFNQPQRFWALFLETV